MSTCCLEFIVDTCDITFELTCTGPQGPAGPAGGIDSMANVGTGEGTVFKDIVAQTANLKTLKAGSGVVISNLPDEIQIDATGAGGGQANTTSNEGIGGVGLALPKQGVNLPFKNVNAGSAKVVVSDDVANNEVDIDVDEAQFAHMQITSGNPHGVTPAIIGAEPADATILKQADVDDTPVNGATTVPPSSNWAFGHQNDFSLHVTSDQNAALDGADAPSGLNVFATISAVTFETLNLNGDVGPGANQVAQGDHLHAGVYEPADATILKQADVDDTPVNGALVAPISSNWAYDHEVAADPHPSYAFKTTTIGTVEGIQGGGDISANRQFKLDINGLVGEASPVAATDYLAIYDASALGHKKVLLQDLPYPPPSLAFTDLIDTEPSYIGQQGKLVKVNATEDGLIFGDPSGSSVAWGDITGTLSNQTDLQAALDAKIGASGVTYENLAANGDVGTGADQVAQGDHLHPGEYDPAGSAATVQSDLDNHKGVVNAHGVTTANIGATEEAPQDGIKYSRQNAAWIESPQTPTGGLSVNYRFSTATSATDPGVGNVKLNNADFALATELYISTTTRFGNPVNPVLDSWGTSDYFNLRDALNNKGAVYQITAPPTDNGGWFTFPIAVLEGEDGPIVNARDVIISQIDTPASRVPRGGAVGQVLEKTGAGDFAMDWADPSGGASTFLELDDTEPSYLGQQGKLVKVNATEDGLIFGDPSGTTVSWGDISGTLSNQTDLQAALDAKEDSLGNPLTDGHVLSSTIAGARTWVAKIDATGVTYENLNANGDVGVGADQVAKGDHLHGGVYEPALGNPASDGFVLESTALGARSWRAERVVPDGGVEGQIIVKNSATEQDASWYEIPTPLSSTWAFNDNTTATDPGAGQFKLNAATQAATTALYFNDQNASGISIGQYLQQLKVGQDIICIQANQISRAARYEVSGAVVDNTGWYTVPVTFVDQGSGGEFRDGKNVVFDFSGLGGGSIVSWGEIVGTLSDQLDLQTALDAKIGSVVEDTAPLLGGDLQTDGNIIRVEDDTPTEYGQLLAVPAEDGVALARPTSGVAFAPATDAAVLVTDGELQLFGQVVQVPTLKGAGETQVYASADGVLYGVQPPDPGWEETDTDDADYSFPTLATWVQITGLFITIPQDVTVGDRVDAFINLYFQNGSATRGGTIDVGFGIDGALPTTSISNVRINGGFDAVVPIALTTTSHGGLLTGQTINVFVRRASEDHSQFDPQVLGSIDPSELIVSVPGSGGGGGGIPEPPNNAYGYLRKGTPSHSWVRGSQVSVQATEPVGPADGDVWIDTT